MRLRLLFLPLLLVTLALPVVVGAQNASISDSASVYPIREGYVDAHELMIYYKTFGRGKPLLILHGGPGASHDYFLPYLTPLARNHQLIFIDERGSGRSQTLEDASGYTVENMVEDVEAVRQALGLGQISLLGALLRRRPCPGLRPEISEESFPPDPGQHLLQHQGH